MCVITHSWTIAQIHNRVAKSRHLSKIAEGCQNCENRGFRDFEFLLTLRVWYANPQQVEGNGAWDTTVNNIVTWRCHIHCSVLSAVAAVWRRIGNKDADRYWQIIAPRQTPFTALVHKRRWHAWTETNLLPSVLYRQLSGRVFPTCPAITSNCTNKQLFVVENWPSSYKLMSGGGAIRVLKTVKTLQAVRAPPPKNMLNSLHLGGSSVVGRTKGALAPLPNFSLLESFSCPFFSKNRTPCG